MKQESVAVFIPNNQQKLGDIEVIFSTHFRSIDSAIRIIKQKLPISYQQAFTLHLNMKGLNLFNPKVTAIEWLGSKISLEEIQKSFPHEKVIFHYGSAVLVYKNGAVEYL